MSCFFLDFWDALGTPWDGLTCNPYAPAQSKHTLLFSHVFKKMASKRCNFGSILGVVFGKNHDFAVKKGFQKMFQKHHLGCATRGGGGSL